MNFHIKVIFHFVSAWHANSLSPVPTKMSSEMGMAVLPLWALAVHRNSHPRLMDFLIKS